MSYFTGFIGTIIVLMVCLLTSAGTFLVHSCTTPKNVRENISDKNKQIEEMGYNIELNLYDYVSDDFLKYAIERNNVFEPVNILSAPIDTILSHREKEKYDKLRKLGYYNAYLLAGKVIDIRRKRYHYAQSIGGAHYDNSDSVTHSLEQKIYCGEVIFLQLETDGSIVHVVLDEDEQQCGEKKEQILSKTIVGGYNNEALEREEKLKTLKFLQDVELSGYLYTGNEKKLENYSSYNMAKGDSVYVAVNDWFGVYYLPEYSPDTTYENYAKFSIPRVRHLEKQDKTGIFDMSFLHKDKVFKFSYYIRSLNKTFNKKEELLKVSKNNAQYILVGIYRDGYREETWQQD